ncbi:hypothetical protein JXQ70_06260 [bacterium]|nr:hypothetical protein [bacterium]
MKTGLRVIYTSYQPYSVKLGIKLAEKYDWKPLYWISSELVEKDIKTHFPDTVTHDIYQAIRGLQPKGKIFKLGTIDEKLLNEFAVYESISMNMFNRNDPWDCFSQRDRLERYHYFLKYWLGVLDELKPDVILFEEVPHQVYSYILYEVARKLDIKTIIFLRTNFVGRMFPVKIFEDGSPIIRKEYNLKLERGETVTGEFAPDIQSFLDKLKGNYSDVQHLQLWNQLDLVNKQKKSARQHLVDNVKYHVWRAIKLFNLLKFKKRALYILNLRKTRYNIDYKANNGKLFDQAWPTGIHIYLNNRKSQKRNAELRALYEKLANPKLRLDVPYVTCMLASQPEQSSSPPGGHFVSQLLIVEMLRNAIPEDWYLYVKEHIHQYGVRIRLPNMTRSEKYYSTIKNMPRTDLVPLFYDTFKLIDNSKAVATITGSSGFEAIIRNKPALIFGHAWYKYCEGVCYSGNINDLREQINRIKAGYTPDQSKVALFIQTIQENTFEGVVGGPANTKHGGERGEPDRNAEEHLKAIETLFQFT